MTIYGEKSYLRSITADDLEYVFQGLSDPEVIRYYGVSFKTIEETKEQMDWFTDLEKNNTGKWWAVCSKENNKFLGAGGVNDLDQNNKKAEIGFWLLPQFWGKGIMKEAFPLILEYSFEAFNLCRIEGYVDANNHKCKQALEKTNMVLDEFKNFEEIKNGKSIILNTYYVSKIGI